MIASLLAIFNRATKIGKWFVRRSLRVLLYYYFFDNASHLTKRIEVVYRTSLREHVSMSTQCTHRNMFTNGDSQDPSSEIDPRS